MKKQVKMKIIQIYHKIKHYKIHNSKMLKNKNLQ